MPAVNPDGYVYTWLDDRLWRKNRSPPPTRSDCYGTDINRNWGFQFGSSGASDDPCSNIYKGVGPFSEPEVQAVKAAVDAVIDEPETDLSLYVSYHSFSQLILFPWCYTTNIGHADESRMMDLGYMYSRAVNLVHHMYYQPQGASKLYTAAGCSMDYVRSQGVANAITVELRASMKANDFGFQLPANQIYPTFEENKAGISEVLRFLKNTTL